MFFFYRLGGSRWVFFIAFTVTPVAPMLNTRLCILLVNVCLFVGVVFCSLSPWSVFIHQTFMGSPRRAEEARWLTWWRCREKRLSSGLTADGEESLLVASHTLIHCPGGTRRTYSSGMTHWTGQICYSHQLEALGRVKWKGQVSYLYFSTMFFCRRWIPWVWTVQQWISE